MRLKSPKETSMNTEIREMLESYKRLYHELDEMGGPVKNGELFETVIGLEEDILEAMDLPPAQKYRTILWGENMDAVISQLNETRKEYEKRPIRDKTLILVDAIVRQIDEPENILPLAGLSHHTYQIFLFREKLLASNAPDEADKIIAEMRTAEEYLNELGRLEMGGIRKHPDLYMMLHETGLQNLDEYLMRNDRFDLADEDMDARQFLVRGFIRANKGRIDDGIRDLSEAIRIMPDMASLYYNRAVAFEMKGDTARAIEDYSLAIELDPENYQALCNRGAILAREGMHEEALVDLNRAIAARPKMPEAYCNRGNLYANIEQQELAIEDYISAITLDPGNAYLYCNRGISYHRIGKKERAIEDLRKSAGMGFEKAKEALADFFSIYPEVNNN
jgi:tetratricopeptide (TPR) repeat protein